MWGVHAWGRPGVSSRRVPAWPTSWQITTMLTLRALAWAQHRCTLSAAGVAASLALNRQAPHSGHEDQPYNLLPS